MSLFLAVGLTGCSGALSRDDACAAITSKLSKLGKFLNGYKFEESALKILAGGLGDVAEEIHALEGPDEFNTMRDEIASIARDAAEIFNDGLASNVNEISDIGARFTIVGSNLLEYCEPG